MASNQQAYPIGVPYRQPRPRGDSLGGTIFGALLGLAISSSPIGLVTGAALGNLVSQPLSLEAAIRTYFSSQGLTVIGFYRLGPQAATILFRYRDQFWTVGSAAPNSPSWTPESLDDWLYGDITEKQLPNKLAEIDTYLTR
jgi:hypothetical protein